MDKSFLKKCNKIAGDTAAAATRRIRTDMETLKLEVCKMQSAKEENKKIN